MIIELKCLVYIITNTKRACILCSSVYTQFTYICVFCDFEVAVARCHDNAARSSDWVYVDQVEENTLLSANIMYEPEVILRERKCFSIAIMLLCLKKKTLTRKLSLYYSTDVF